jgi:hypothetical protein
MQRLNLPEYSFKTKMVDGKTQIFDAFRKKYVVLTPEEWVRQNFLQYLVTEKKYPASRIALEYPLQYNTLSKRGDIVIFSRSGQPEIIIECKAPSVKVSQDTFDQAARYNFVLKLRYLVVTNGLQHYCCEMDYEKGTYVFLPDLPVHTGS